MKTWHQDFFMLVNNDTYFSKCSNKVERHWNHHSWSSLQVWMPTNKNRQVDLIFQWHIRQSDEIQYVAEYLICYWPLSIRVRWFGPSEQQTHKIKTKTDTFAKSAHFWDQNIALRVAKSKFKDHFYSSNIPQIWSIWLWFGEFITFGRDFGHISILWIFRLILAIFPL